ncbi:IS4 family transposase [Candidatus Kuenenia sp.]|uniref:IS4 family transposase n=1 Tax=Candidatus Kuenenia sp. TaxID=2499824 RepID=UPI00321F8585
MMKEDWDLLRTFFPNDWKSLAVDTNALKGLRKDKSEEKLLRTLLIHLGCGYSLRETVVRAKRANLADLSDVALLKRLKKSKEWLYKLCVSLFRERGLQINKRNNFHLRLFDATTVKEPGKTGSLWRIHYSIEVPSLSCDFFKLTGTEGEGTGESFRQFPMKKDDYIIADRGYCTGQGIHYTTRKGAYLSVRVNSQSLRIFGEEKNPFPLLKEIQYLKRPLAIKSWNVFIPNVDNTEYVKGRLCIIRKTEEAIKIAHKKLKRHASKKGIELKPETLIYAKYVIVFTTFPENQFTAFDILEWYRVRWQTELVFKRFKQIAQFGHLPKYDDDSSKAWLYGKLFVALLTEKLIDFATSFSPWGYIMVKPEDSKPMA